MGGGAMKLQERETTQRCSSITGIYLLSGDLCVP
jgi:hypothetical protein